MGALAVESTGLGGVDSTRMAIGSQKQLISKTDKVVVMFRPAAVLDS